MPIESNIKEEILNDNTNITSNSKQLAVLKQHFPNCFDKDGNFMSHKMEEIVGSGGLELSKESYSLNWLGKSYARLLANENPRTLLKENKTHNALEENKNSKNLLIKGDNLEVLKHLSHAYSEQIKMIYIDPPYNTGGDGFVYNDDRKFTVEELSRLAGVDKDEAKRILDFTASKANSHSAWLTFMYPRLYVARELLREDGVIFISIDDNEVSQLKLLCDEVFGEENFVGDLTWEKKKKGTFLSNSLTNIKESILVYSKEKYTFNGLIGEIKTDKETYPCINASNKREKRIIPKGIKSKYRKPSFYLEKGSEISDTTMSLILHSDLIIENNILMEDVIIEGNWRYTQKNLNIYGEEDNLYITQDLYIRRIVTDARYKTIKDLLLREGTNKNLKYENFNSKNLFEDGWGSNEDAEEELRLLLGKIGVFSNPKPIKLLKKLITTVRDDNMIILDFFAGSGTTAHAVMALNAEDKGNRKFITVQIDERTDPKSEAYKAGYESIFDITKARIEKASVALGDKSGFKIFETTPLFEGYLDEIEELNEETTLFNGQDLNSEELEQLLITWKSHDGMVLTEELKEVMLGEYVAEYGGNTLYLMQVGFSMDALEVLIEKLDNDENFEPSKIVLFGYNFESKAQRELKEGLKNYKNKKSIELEMIVRY